MHLSQEMTQLWWQSKLSTICLYTPANILKRLVLPEPFLPIIPKLSPGFSSNVILSNILLKFFLFFLF